MISNYIIFNDYNKLYESYSEIMKGCFKFLSIQSLGYIETATSEGMNRRMTALSDIRSEPTLHSGLWFSG